MIKKVVIAGDAHIPFTDIRALELFHKFLKEWQPNALILNGDWIDCYEVSQFSKAPIDKAEFVAEIESAKKELKKLRQILPNAEIKYIEGNHEMRLKKYLISKARELYKLFIGGFFDEENNKTLLEYLLGCHKLDIDYHPVREELDKFSHNYIDFHGIKIGHFDKVLKNGGYTARALRDDLGSDIIQSHTHRIGSSYKTYLDRIGFGLEIGCLCEKPTYTEAPDWQLGFLAGYLDEKDNFYPYQIILKDYHFIFENKRYEV